MRVPTLAPPTKTAQTLSDAEMATLKAGVALYEKSQYDAAIEKYQEVLRANPDATQAIYETALATYSKGNPAKAIEIAAPLVQYQSPDLPRHYAFIGSMFDELKQPKDAIAVYEMGIAVAPTGGTLYYNKAVTELQSLHDATAAIATLKRGATADPAHAGLQYLLAGLYGSSQLRTPQLLALSRFLLLEPAGARAVTGFKTWYGLLTSNVTVGADGKSQIAVNPNKVHTPEGNLAELDLQIALAQVAASAGAGSKTDLERLVDDWSGLLGVWGKYKLTDGDADTFLWTYYMPYFAGIRDQHFIEPFVYLICQKVGIQGSAAWIASHQDVVQAFLTWNKSYAWPTAR